MNDGDRKREGAAHPQLDLLTRGDEVEQASGPVSPRIRISARARRLSLRVYPDARVECVVPPRARPREIEQFIAAHREWIDARRATALRNRPPPERFPPESIESRATGETWNVHLAGGQGRLRFVENRGDDGRHVLEIR